MIRSKYNRYIYLLLVLVIFSGTFYMFQWGQVLGFAFFAVTVSFQFLIRCPKCDNLMCRMKEPRMYAPPIPRKCFNCDYRYR